MPVIREWRCADCGTTGETMGSLEDVICPNCSAQEAERVFLTPPGYKSPKTSGTDRDIKNLAADYGLSDVSNKYGEAVKKAPTGDNAPQFAAANPQVSQALSKLGGNADGFSQMIPALRDRGGPRPDWHYRDSKNKSVRS